MLKLDRREAKIGSSINTRTQIHGEENVTALDIPIKGVALSPEELGFVMLNPRAHKLLYTKKKGRPDQPIWGKLFGALPFRNKVKGATVTLYIGRKPLKLIDVNLTKGRLETLEGGTTHWHFTVQCTPDLDESIEALLGRLNTKVDIAIDCQGYGEQDELPLEEDEKPDDEGDDDGEED